MVGESGGHPQQTQVNPGAPNPPIGGAIQNEPQPPPLGVGMVAHHPPPLQGGAMQVPPPFGAVPPFVGENFPVGNVPGGYGFGYGQIPQVAQPTPAMMPWATRYVPLALPV